jgi:formylglycine-generating enzyme required for sulfatase activity
MNIPCQFRLIGSNGRFMGNPFVLWGASCAAPRRHVRRTYRNIFPPAERRQFTSVRLAKEYA